MEILKLGLTQFKSSSSFWSHLIFKESFLISTLWGMTAEDFINFPGYKAKEIC